MKNKDRKYQDVIDTTIRLVGIHGIQGVTISLIALHSKVSRGWIYKYIGQNSEEVITYALNDFSAEFSKLVELVEHSNKEMMFESIYTYTRGMVDQIKKKPLILTIYFANHESDNLIGQAIRNTEGKYLDLLTTNCKNCFNIEQSDARLRAELVHMMRMGAILTFFSKLTDKTVSSWEEKFWKLFKNSLRLLILG